MKIFRKKQLGVTMLELVVSLGIGVILLTALGRVYVTATSEDAIKTLKGELDESARQIFSTMARDISLAGFVDNFDEGTETGQSFGNKVLVQSGNIKKLFNREDNEVTAISLLTGKKFMLPLQGDDRHLTIIYQAKNSNDVNIPKDKDYRSLSGAFDNQDTSGWGMNCVNNTDSALIDHKGEKNNSEPEYNIFLKQDFVFNETDKTFSCGMASWSSMKVFDNNSGKKGEFFANTKKNEVDSISASLLTTGQMKSLVGDKDAKDRVTSVESLKFRYTVTDNKHYSNDEYTVAESVAGYYTDNIYNHEGVKDSDLGWGGVTGVEVCIVIGAAPTFSKKRVDIAAFQPTIPTCERDKDNDKGDVSDAVFKADKTRNPNDRKYYQRYVRTLSAHNALYLR